ncbi:hypothetical protein KAU08_09925 [bacterium]|nr:hypothetical protein [bacterium]
MTGLLFGMIGLIYYAGLPDMKSQDALLRLVKLKQDEMGIDTENPRMNIPSN